MHAYNDIIRIPCVSQSAALKFFIELIQVDVCEQGTQIAALCRARYYAELILFGIQFMRHISFLTLRNAI